MAMSVFSYGGGGLMHPNGQTYYVALNGHFGQSPIKVAYKWSCSTFAQEDVLLDERNTIIQDSW